MTRTPIPDLHSHQWWLLLIGPLAFLAILYGLDLEPGHPEVTRMAAITVWVAIWWFTEPVDLAVTSFLPFVLMPVLGIASPGDTAAQYMDPIIFLFLGGFILAFAMEKWQLHTRLALGILSRTGSAPTRILVGVMVAAFFLSMWVSNTATVLMLVPAVLSIIDHLRGDQASDGRHPVAIALLLGLAYAATMGGMSTLVGTPPNMYFYSFYQRTFPGDASVSFASFFLLAIGITLLLGLGTYAVIRWRYLRNHQGTLPKHYFRDAYRQLGRINRDQRVVILMFILTVLAWFTRPDFALGDRTIPGWATLTGLGSRVNDGMVVIVACLILFMIPARTEPRRILEWRDVHRLPFGIVLLFGSGFALAMGFSNAGLSDWLAARLAGLQAVHPLVLLLVAGVIITVISEFASNIACVQMVLPVMVAIGAETTFPVKGLMLATTLFASLGFMMPVATAPNTIVFGSGFIRTREMIRTGFWINLIGIILISLVVWLSFG
ncbi:MAG: SLC13/DASS family transporter [Lewinellaceae bacterium]|nr:SLC13/DASS family transporter [Saprospiraceae bacterium]MCB9313562.1 SLC13/DASS family transporter [Lewinellaceae bacterium]HRW75475.1 DASS family sodium-coupled anion symporter [Saprospiraceae bacterium]